MYERDWEEYMSRIGSPTFETWGTIQAFKVI